MVSAYASLDIRTDPALRVDQARYKNAGCVVGGRLREPVGEQPVGVVRVKAGVRHVKSDGQAGALGDVIQELAAQHASAVSEVLFISAHARLVVTAAHGRPTAINLEHGFTFLIIGTSGSLK